MKFPSHIILDIVSRDKTTAFTSWDVSFKNKTTLQLNDLQNYINTQNTTTTPSLIFSTPKTNPFTKRDLADHFGSTKPLYLTTNNSPVNNILWDLFNVNFLRKEKIYTKLKYSRCPQYDIVSGGVAAIFSGFLGFLICEKFGLELLDSGDFYVFFMYAVFGTFALRPLLKISDKSDNLWHLFTLYSLYTFLRNLVIMISKTLRFYLTRVGSKTILTPASMKTLLVKFQAVANIYNFFRRLRIFLTNWPKKGFETFREVK